MRRGKLKGGDQRNVEPDDDDDDEAGDDVDDELEKEDENEEDDDEEVEDGDDRLPAAAWYFVFPFAPAAVCTGTAAAAAGGAAHAHVSPSLFLVAPPASEARLSLVSRMWPSSPLLCSCACGGSGFDKKPHASHASSSRVPPPPL